MNALTVGLVSVVKHQIVLVNLTATDMEYVIQDSILQDVLIVLTIRWESLATSHAYTESKLLSTVESVLANQYDIFLAFFYNCCSYLMVALICSAMPALGAIRNVTTMVCVPRTARCVYAIPASGEGNAKTEGARV